MSDPLVERVLVVPTSLFHTLGHFQGFSPDTARYLKVLLATENISYRPRHEVEEDPSYKQLIPYVIFQHRQGSGPTNVFSYKRGAGQDESRLRQRRSIGIGGHISVTDTQAGTEQHPYNEGLRRELDEEVIIDTPYTGRHIGLINDDETNVGRVHLGVVHLFDVEQPAVRPRESEILDAGFSPVSELLVDVDSFETWSQICLRAFF